MQQEKFKLQGPCATIFSGANTGSWRLEHPVVDHEVCVKCGTCSRYCPVGAITVDRTKKEGVSIDFDFCKGCGICANECPKSCITMKEGNR